MIDRPNKLIAIQDGFDRASIVSITYFGSLVKQPLLRSLPPSLALNRLILI